MSFIKCTVCPPEEKITKTMAKILFRREQRLNCLRELVREASQQDSVLKRLFYKGNDKEVVPDEIRDFIVIELVRHVSVIEWSTPTVDWGREDKDFLKEAVIRLVGDSALARTLHDRIEDKILENLMVAMEPSVLFDTCSTMPAALFRLLHQIEHLRLRVYRYKESAIEDTTRGLEILEDLVANDYLPILKSLTIEVTEGCRQSVMEDKGVDISEDLIRLLQNTELDSTAQLFQWRFVKLKLSPWYRNQEGEMIVVRDYEDGKSIVWMGTATDVTAMEARDVRVQSWQGVKSVYG